MRIARLVALTVVLIFAAGCATPKEYARFRYVGEDSGTEDDFVIAREECRWQSPPIPIVEKYVYRSCMVRRGWIANE